MVQVLSHNTYKVHMHCTVYAKVFICWSYTGIVLKWLNLSSSSPNLVVV